MSRRSTRRDFLKQTAVAGAGFWLAGGLTEVHARPGPSERLNLAFIGAGGQGGGNLRDMSQTENIVALCDVDEQRAGGAFKSHPKATRYTDFRVMLDKQKNIDAVVVSTPDHMHTIASVMAMRMGKHCYTEKPLTHDVAEARLMKETAAKHKVVTQMGNMGTGTDGFRTNVEIIRSGSLGPVHEVHVWTNRPGSFWRQGMAQRPKTQPVPKTLSWDLWIGTAPFRDYNRAYAPFDWRGWWDFGTGALGDMACHTMNLPYMALRLGFPTSVIAETDQAVNNESPPNGCRITYEFPARDKMPSVRLYWYEVRKPPDKLFQGEKISGSGSLIIGEKGTLFSNDDYGDRRRLLPLEAFKEFKPPERSLPRVTGAPPKQHPHRFEWLRACKNGKQPPLSNFDYAASLTEVVLLGNVAMRAGKKIVWNHDKMQAVGLPQADQYIRRTYRKGWTL
jgi:predicted dehydrogenase